MEVAHLVTLHWVWPGMCFAGTDLRRNLMASNFDSVAAWVAPESTRGVSWLGLVAQTAFGGMELAQLRVQIGAEAVARRGVEDLRLIVQSYASQALGDDRRPRPHARPLASLQRMVRPGELEAGVVVDLLQLDAVAGEVVVVAWIEAGDTHLEYDARRARPALDCWYGEALADAKVVTRLRLRLRAT